MLQLRLALGIGVKTDALAYLIGREGQWATVRNITRATAYTPAAVRRAVEQMADGQIIERKYEPPAVFCADPLRWRDLLVQHGPTPLWHDWHPRFLFAVGYAESADRRLLERHRAAFHDDPKLPEDADSGEARRVIHTLANWMTEHV